MKKEEAIEITEFREGAAEFCVLGTQPLIFNRKTEQSKHELLLPKRKESKATMSSRLKHDPVQEFRSSVYRFEDETTATLLGLPAPAFKGAMCTAALDNPGAAKSKIARLTRVDSYFVPIYGLPKLLMSDVKMANMARTPDVRTRAILQEWASRLTIRYIKPAITEKDVVRLFAASGMSVGVGDFRQEKGKGNFGLYRIVSPDDKDWNRIVKTQGRKAQEEALRSAEPFNSETFDLMAWLRSEAHDRGFKLTT